MPNWIISQPIARMRKRVETMMDWKARPVADTRPIVAIEAKMGMHPPSIASKGFDSRILYLEKVTVNERFVKLKIKISF